MSNTEKVFPFLKYAPFFGGVSALLVLIFGLYLAIRGLPYGIDFRGGTEVHIQFAKPVSLAQLRQGLEALALPNLTVLEYGSSQDYLVRFQLSEGEADQTKRNQEQNQRLAGITSFLSQDSWRQFEGKVLRVDAVGPQVGNELKRAGALSIFYSLLIILIYISMRFDYKYAPGAVLCLIHDVVVTLGVFVALGREVQLPVIAAILTLIGYSLNDTIVVFDRIREVANKYTKLSFRDVIDLSLTQMWRRTLVTSGTTLVVAVALAVLTQGAISDIALIMSVGIIVGTYSSVYVAAPLTWLLDWLWGGKSFDWVPKPRFEQPRP